MSTIITPGEVGTKLASAQSRGDYRNAGQDLLSSFANLYGVAFDESSAQVNGNSSSLATYGATGATLAGIGTFVGVRNNFDTLRINIYPFDAENLPRYARVRVRLGAYDATPVADVLVFLRNVVPNKTIPVVAELGSLIANAGNDDVWVEVLCNGKIGAELSTVATATTGTNVQRYTTNQAMTNTTLASVASSASNQLLCRTFVSGSRNTFSIGLEDIQFYTTGGFTAWSNALSTLPGKFNVLEVPVYAFDAAVLPTELRLRFRQTDYDGAIIATAKADVHFTGVGYQVVTFAFDADITLSGVVWMEIVANGRIGMTVSTTRVLTVQRYSGTAAGIDGLTTVQSNPAGQLLQWFFRSVLRDRTKVKGFSAAKLSRFVAEKATGGSSATPFTPLCDLTLPPFIPCIEGIETNIYWDGIFTSWIRPEQYNIRANCARGRHDDLRWRIVPSASGYGPAAGTGTDIGTTAMTIEASFNGTLIKSATTSLRIKADSVGNGQTRKCLVIGDSTTEGGEAVQQVLDQVTASSSTYAVTMLGTRGTGLAQHEGYSGKHYNYLRTNDAANKFYNAGDFDFAYYLSNNSFTMSAGDSVFLLMGLNPPISGNLTDDACYTALLGIMTDLSVIIASIRAAVSGINVWLGLVIPPCHDQSGFGNNYLGNGLYRDRVNRNIGLERRAFLDAYAASEASNIRLAPVNCNLDTVNNVQVATEAINAQNATTRSVQSNGVHPAASGYKQIGDMLYCCLKSLES